MADQSESFGLKSTSSSTSKAPKRGRRKGTPGVEYGNLTFRLPLAMERSLRFVCFQLEVNPKAIHKTPDALVEEAVRRHLELLGKHMPLNPGGAPDAKAPSEPAS